jgi:hypothetical protein
MFDMRGQQARYGRWSVKKDSASSQRILSQSNTEKVLYVSRHEDLTDEKMSFITDNGEGIEKKKYPKGSFWVADIAMSKNRI